MYKCTVCGSEFEMKPDFCDCGNDEFVTTQKDEIQKENKPNTQDLLKKDAVSVKPSVKPAEVQTKRYDLKKQRTLSSFDLISVLIFVLCIILSIVVICYKPEKTTLKNNENTTKQVSNTKTIPDINVFWNDKIKEVNEIKAIKQEQPVEETVKIVQISPKVINTKKQDTNSVKKQPVKNITNVPIKKTEPKTANNTQKNITEVKNTNKNTKTQTQQTVKPQEEITKNAPQTVSTQNSQNVQITVVPKKNDVISEASKKELENYKVKLRNAIGQKIDFTQVVGDGSCVISFKINSSGKLINRSFTKLSENITLNDAVYKAVMKTPSYNPPPEAYNNETLNLSIKFYNGNFEIYLK